MARVVTPVCNICYASGKFLHAGMKYDMEDTSLDSKVVAVLEEQLKKGRVVEVKTSAHAFPLTGVEKVSTGGVEAQEEDITAYPNEIQEAPAEVCEEVEEAPSTDAVIADLAKAATRARRQLGRK